MRHPILKAVGYALVGAVMAGLALRVIAAAVSNRPFYGVNYKGLPLSTYSTLSVLAVLTVAGLAKLISWALRRSRH